MLGRRITEPNRVYHFSQMPLGLVGEEWEPGGAEFEKARAGAARSLTRLARVKVPPDQVQDWEVRSWLRHKHYGDPTMQGLHQAIRAQEIADNIEHAARARPPARDLFNRGGSDADA